MLQKGIRLPLKVIFSAPPSFYLLLPLGIIIPFNSPYHRFVNECTHVVLKAPLSFWSIPLLSLPCHRTKDKSDYSVKCNKLLQKLNWEPRGKSGKNKTKKQNGQKSHSKKKKKKVKHIIRKSGSYLLLKIFRSIFLSYYYYWLSIHLCWFSWGMN